MVYILIYTVCKNTFKVAKKKKVSVLFLLSFFPSLPPLDLNVSLCLSLLIPLYSCSCCQPLFLTHVEFVCLQGGLQLGTVLYICIFCH